MLGEDFFHQMIYLERKRTERSGKPFLLMLMNTKGSDQNRESRRIARMIGSSLNGTLRETDIKGWYEHDFIVGVLFTEIGEADIYRAKKRILEKVSGSLCDRLGEKVLDGVSITFEVFERKQRERILSQPLNVEPLPEESTDRSRTHTWSGFFSAVLRRGWFLVAGDLLFVMVSFLLSVWIRLGTFSAVLEVHPGAYALTLLLYPAALYVFDLYNVQKHFQLLRASARMAMAIAAVTGFSASIFYILPEWQYGRGILVVQMIVTWAVLTGWRGLYGIFFHVSRSKEGVLVLGSGDSCDEICQVLSSPFSRYEVMGFLDDDPSRPADAVTSPAVLGTVDRICEIAGEMGVRTVVTTISRDRSIRLTRKILEARLRGIDVVEMPTVYEKLTGRVPVEHIEDQWLLFADGFYLISKEYVQRLKRIMDLVVSSFLMLVTAPIMLLTALAIRVESPGPVFYTQDRVGKGCKVFPVKKFRSMRVDAEAQGAQWALKRDPRVTRVGLWIRLFRIDELPQIWNVFKGDMSLVGPRPERPEFVKELDEQISYYSVRHTVPPGITGWAQVRYPYGSSIEDAVRKLEYDLYYIKNMSVLLDLKILLRTVGVVLTGEGAR